MVSYNINWERWIKASIAKHFNVPLITDVTKFFVEGFERDTENEPHYVELRIDGPYFEEVTKGHWKIEIEINTAICVTEDPNDAYKMEYVKGRVTKLFIDCFDIYKFGNSEEDDNTKLGCFKIKYQGREKIVTTNFGKVRPDTRHLQASIEAHFVMFLD